MPVTPSQSLELTSFRRTFTLVILLVVLPSAGLSGFGVVAIINERAAVEKRLEAAWGGRVDKAALQLQQTLAGATVAQKDPLILTLADGTVATDEAFSVTRDTVETPDPKLKAALAPVSSELSALPEHPVFFSLSSLQGSFLVVAMREGEGSSAKIAGAKVSPRALGSVLEKTSALLVPQSERGHFELRTVKREGPEGVMGKLANGVADVREALGPRELASHTLPSPLQDFRLVAVPEGDDPVAADSTRNRTVYAILLGVFYLTLAGGVVYTGRTLYREVRLSRLKTDFVSLVSHELRTPLTSIRMFIDTLAMGRVKNHEDEQKILKMLSQETERLSALIESVLDWARIEGGRKQYDKKPTRAQEIVDAAVSAFKVQRLYENVPLSIAVKPDLPPIDADLHALSGAVLNLLQNAYKYTGQDRKIALEAGPDKRGVFITVADNGIGIAKADLKKIFDRFYRVDNLLTRQTEGSGLGLSIAQRIVHAHGGKITVSSEPGKGSTFTLHLPKAEAHP
ncbi:MAG: HAMP domain-containing sensor histidine kinase [Myxococcaceae bacterium]